MIRILLIWVACCLPTYAATEWPTWLGEELQPKAASHWRAESVAEGVSFVPTRSLSKILVIVSRKASSYDVALKTLLNVYSTQLPQVQWVVKRLPVDNAMLVNLLHRAENEVDLVYTLGSKATVSVHKVYQGGLLPVVSVNSKDPVLLGLTDDYAGTGNNFAFTSLNLLTDVTLRIMQRFNPQLKQIGILYSRTNQSAYLTQFLPMKKFAEKVGLTVVPIVVDESKSAMGLKLVMDTAMTRLKKTDPELNNTLLWLTGSSSLLARVDEINQLSQQLALISAVPDVVNGTKASALMSFGVSFVNNATQAALYGIQILKKEAVVGDLPVGVISPPDISISFRQVARINQSIPFELMEMASDVYDIEGRMIRSNGMSVEDGQ
ncbi:hypothetical protein AKG98_432 [Moritella sp. JT01]|uniref:ABC transporter substrate binding protein n=1 Tax=Moritella sp. JT01 TaxID=756698 RepID=UPI00079BFFAF|nr:ABC transporter substrate binding protein [Moritella sp. JT01]KXO14352.1 hypothetical protein AKG98_432 [Moritella sp. JT01]